jgi:oligoendopeptidase F
MTESNATALGTVPEWDLSDLYSGPDSADLKSDLDGAAKAAADFAKAYEGNVAKLDGAGLAKAIQEFETIQDTIGRVASFAQLTHAGNMNDPAISQFYQNTVERVNDISVLFLFFSLEINRMSDDDISDRLKDAGVSKYGPWIRDIRVYRNHELSNDLEKLLHEKHVTGAASWSRLFDETMSSLTFPVEGSDLSAEQALHRLSDQDRSVRRAAAESLSAVFEENNRLFALVTNTLAKDKEIEDRWRNYDHPASSRHLSNFVEPEVVAALKQSVQDAYPNLSHRYYKMKASWMGLDRLEYWDRNAPLPEDADRLRPWDEARDTVLDAYAKFAPDLADLGRKFFDNDWIDAAMRSGKSPGAFAHPTVPSAHPYLLLNYQGKKRDVMTLAHELGHGVHQLLAAPNGALMADTPLTLAETASVFGEQLTFRALLDGESDPAIRRVMLAGKVEDMLNTVVRQVAFYDFELRVHEERRSGELTPDRIGEIWLAVQSESLGPAFSFADEYRNWWCYIPHFIHSPFYVYAYAFGDCLVNSLYSVYLDTDTGFQDKYFDMLRAGGTKHHRELLAPFGLDASEPAFWSRGLTVISSFIDDLEEMAK